MSIFLVSSFSCSQAESTPAAPNDHRDRQEQAMVKREVESTDRQIDKLVYELYGLSEEEIRIVES